MKRIQEKIKDLVDVRPYKRLNNYLEDPAQTLSSYYFTDDTADLMAVWLDNVSDVQTASGAARALAGYRGVGKSHFLATLGAIVSQPELRSRISEAHVAASAQRLKRRRHLVAYVERGTYETLLDEVKAALSVVTETDLSSLSDSLPELLAFAAEKANDLPLVVIIDTAQDRPARVQRDDGEMLGEMAEIARNLNIFIGIALDDDISGADNVNAAIARSYHIDYLDQEHLYKIVDTHLFPKRRQTQPVLHEVYSYLKDAIPNFKWSEQRFSSLYPLHPIILEVTPFVRLYSPEFALLPFAAEAGGKIASRPANSLIAIDEVFDRAEAGLRKADNLKEAFVTYDRVAAEVISHVPVMQRLQAKMILKGLLLLSLDGDGTTAGDISAAMLLHDENDPAKAARDIAEVLDTFVSFLPDDIRRTEEEGREVRYNFRVSGKDDLNAALAEAAQSVDPLEVTKLLRRAAKDKFTDWVVSGDSEDEGFDTLDSQILWRGGYRRGRVVWNWGGDTAVNENGERPSVVADLWDWEVVINDPNGAAAAPASNDALLPAAVWQPALLRTDETETLRRYCALLNDPALKESYGEQVRAAGHTLMGAVKKIWNRLFLEDATILIGGEEYLFTAQAQTAATLSEMLSFELAPMFEARYPEHPIFAAPLGMNQVSQLVQDLFSGAKQPSPEVQQLAQIFALPLGLVAPRGGNFVLESDEKIGALPWVRDVLSLVGEKDAAAVPLKEIYRVMKKEPYGLVREAQHLVLSALVAQRRIEFVTSKGDRINRRSLDLKIIWDDIVSVERPSEDYRGDVELTNWAKLITGAEDLRSLDDEQGREGIHSALNKWLSDWQQSRLLQRFDELPEGALNTRVWRLADRTHKTFGTVAVAVEAISEKTISLEEGLQRIADAFLDSQEEFDEAKNKLIELEDFIVGARKREEVWQYLAVSEPTDDAGIEELRYQNLQVLEQMDFGFSKELNLTLTETWMDFGEQFQDHFALNHDRVMKSHHLQETLEEIMQSNEWWEFENLSKLPVFPQAHFEKAKKIREKMKDLNCGFDVRTLLRAKPFCACSFRLTQMQEWEKLPQVLQETVGAGRESYRGAIRMLREPLLKILEGLAKKETDEDIVKSINWLGEVLSKNQPLPLLGNTEIRVLEKALKKLPASTVLKVKPPEEKGAVNREELKIKLNEWLDNLPNEPVLLNLVSSGKTE
jgi:hypothetical protein